MVTIKIEILVLKSNTLRPLTLVLKTKKRDINGKSKYIKQVETHIPMRGHTFSGPLVGRSTDVRSRPTSGSENVWPRIGICVSTCLMYFDLPLISRFSVFKTSVSGQSGCWAARRSEHRPNESSTVEKISQKRPGAGD